MLIKLNSLFVNDQDKALKFYTEVLGFQVETNEEYAPDVRWVTVVSPDDPTGTQLQLATFLVPEAEAMQRAMYQAGHPIISLTCLDIRADYDRLKAAGVTFTQELRDMGPAGKNAVFDDTVGNLVNLHQD